MRLTLDGITIDVSDADAAFYLRAGYRKVDEPVDIPAHYEKSRSKREKRSSVTEEAEEEGEE